MLAVIIDLLILAVIDVAVIYFTMQICGLGVEDLAMLPKGPLLAFLLVQNGGYLVAFTAGGQTLGKMAAGIRVVPAASDAPLDLGRAFLRTLMWGVLAVPAGLGFLTGPLQPRSPRPARSLRRHARRPRVGLKTGLDGARDSRNDRRTPNPDARITSRWRSPSPPSAASATCRSRPARSVRRPACCLWLLLGPSAVVRASPSSWSSRPASGAPASANGTSASTDPGHVVIDEVMGMLITLFLIPVGWAGALGAFLLFRLVDIVKPYPANRFEQLHGGLGVMADDCMAAVYANLALRAILALGNRVIW